MKKWYYPIVIYLQTIIKKPSVTIVIMSLIEKSNELYSELALNHLPYKL